MANMKIRHKTPEHLEAQVGEFVAGAPWYLYDSMRHSIGQIARSGMSQMFSGEEALGGSNEANVEPKIIDNLDNLDYLDYLKHLRGRNHIERTLTLRKAELVRNYQEFDTVVEPLLALVRGYNGYDFDMGIPGYLGEGIHSIAVKITYDGKEYVVRIPLDGTQPADVDDHLIGALRRPDIPGLEKIVAASFDQGVTVAEVAPGIPMVNMTLEIAQRVTDKQMEDFVKAYIIGQENGLRFDADGGNLLYDPDDGFTIIDYSASTYVEVSEVYPKTLSDFFCYAGYNNGDIEGFEITDLLLSKLQLVAVQLLKDTQIEPFLKRLTDNLEENARSRAKFEMRRRKSL